MQTFKQTLKNAIALTLLATFASGAVASGAVLVAQSSAGDARTSEPSTAPNTPQLSVATTPQVGQLETVAELEITPGNVTVSRSGRIFASVHGMRRGSAQLVEVFPGQNQWQAFPNAEWNAAPGSGPNVLNTAHGVAIDSQDRLWVIDHGNWMPNDAAPMPPKLLAFDINTRELVFRYDFPESTGPRGGIMQDLAVDAERGFVYIADSGNQPAIVTVDINQQTSQRFENHPSLNAEDIDLIVEGESLQLPGSNGEMQPARVPINPITLSADGETLFFGSMNGGSWYSVPARLLREGANDAAIGAGIIRVGAKPVSDGASTDAEGNHFFTNLADGAIDQLSPEGQSTRLVQDDRLEAWADNVRFGQDSWLYIAVNQLHRNPIFTSKADAGTPPYSILRVWTGTQGQPGR